MSLKSLRSVYVLFFILSIFPSCALGQSIGGTFFGVVKDPTGLIPQAEVRITNLATGQGRFVFTDDQGRYELREVPPGLYELKVSKDGYNTVSTPPSQGLQLSLGQVARVDDITLKVAPAGTTTVEVNAMDLAMTDSDRPTLSTAFTEKQVGELPLPARDVNNLAPLAPGVVSVSSFSFANTLVPFSVNGSRGRDNNFIIDSVDNNEPLFGGAATQFSNSEIFSEFRILTGQFQAEYGRNSGSIVNVITKSGGKNTHGSLFWYGQNDALNAMTKVEKQSGLTKPAQFYENQLGASLGGPIKKDSTWYFASYQWDRAKNDLSQEYPVVVTLPTSAGLAMLQSMNAAKPVPTLTVFLADPTVRTLPTLTPPFAAPCAIPNASFPLNANNPCTTGSPTVNGGQIPFGTYVVPRGNIFGFRDHEGSARIDQKIGQRENFFFRYLLDDLRTPIGVVSDPSQVAFSDLGLLPQWRPILAERTQNFGSSWTHAFDRALNELRFSFSRVSSERGPLNADPKERELPAITINDGGDPTGIGIFAVQPSLGFPAAGNFITLGSDSRSARVHSNLFQLQQNFSTIHGIHSLKFGANFIETRSGLRQIPGDLGHYFYFSFQDFVNNALVTGYQRFGNLGGKGGEVLPLREFAQFYFAEDDIKVSPHFALNLGVRYENYGQAYNHVVDLSASNPDSPPRLGRVNTNFAPRLGFAWELEKNTVLRGGYGIYYDPTFFNIALLVWQSGSISPYVSSITGPVPNSFPNRPFSAADASAPFPDFTGDPFGECDLNPVPFGEAPPTSQDCTNQNTVSKNLRNPFVHDASLGLQHQLGKGTLIEVSYVGSRGTKLFQRRNLNPYGGWLLFIPPSCSGAAFCGASLVPRNPRNRGAIIDMSNGAYSNYHALQFSVTKPLRGESFWNRIALTGAYTWSHMTDNASEVFGPGVQRTGLSAGPLSAQNPFDLTEPFETSTPFPQDALDPRKGEKGNSSFDSRHRLALSAVWALPSPGRKIVRALLGTWELSGVLTAQSGQPFTPINSSVSNPGGSSSISSIGALAGTTTGCGDVGGDGIVFNDRPNIGNLNAPANTVALINNVFCLDPANSNFSSIINIPGFQIVNGAGPYITPDGMPADPTKVRFYQVGIGCDPKQSPCGNAGRNILVGPGIVNFDLSLSKGFRLGDRLRMQFRGDAYNLLNRRNSGPIVGNSYVASAQQVPAVAFYPTIGVGSQAPICVTCLFHVQTTSFTLARTSGLTPENSIDATDPTTGKPLFLSRRFLATSSRRMQLSLKFTF